MYASNLETELYSLMANADVARGDPSEFAERMESLRNSGRLPRGRENHATLLTDEQIADVILGLVTPRPKWAGHTAIILRSLKPVGGLAASFEQADNLNTAIQKLLGSKEARERFIDLSLTTAEHGKNANGHAVLRYKDGDELKTTCFVHQLAVSLHGAGAEKTYNPSRSSPPSARQLVLGPEYFSRLAREIETIRRLKPKPASDGSEYDAAEAEARRLKALGVRIGSRYLNIGVDNQVTWPRTETLVKFDRFSMVLLPKTKDHTTSISMDLTANKLNDVDALTVINRFLSLLCFCDDQYAVAQDGWSGNPIPVPVSRRNLAFTTATYWVFDRKLPESKDALRALALYREARNAEQNFLVSYAVLNFYKIVEILYDKDEKVRRWLTKNFETLSAHIDAEVLTRFNEERGSTEPGRHIFDTYRLAVAHASVKTPSDPDESSELSRLYTAARVLRPIARYFMKNELGLSDSHWEQPSA